MQTYVYILSHITETKKTNALCLRIERFFNTGGVSLVTLDNVAYA